MVIDNRQKIELHLWDFIESVYFTAIDHNTPQEIGNSLVAEVKVEFNFYSGEDVRVLKSLSLHSN